MLSDSIAALRGVQSSLRHMAGGNRALSSSFFFSQSYALSAPGARMLRGLALLPAEYHHSLLIVDEGASGAAGGELLQWHMHTFANVTCSAAGYCALLAMSWRR